MSSLRDWLIFAYLVIGLGYTIWNTFMYDFNLINRATKGDESDLLMGLAIMGFAFTIVISFVLWPIRLVIDIVVFIKLVVKNIKRRS